jgi:hypothetical protein
MRFEVLTAAKMSMLVFWVIKAFSLNMLVVCPSEMLTSRNIYTAIQHSIPTPTACYVLILNVQRPLLVLLTVSFTLSYQLFN